MLRHYISAWLVAVFATLACAQTTISVYPSLAPNVFGSPSFAEWEANAIFALQNGQTTAGNFGLPTYYEQIPNGSLVA
nr:hypothetical protein [Gemmatales bacterium]